MELTAFLDKLTSTPELVAFEESMAVIDMNYDFVATSFVNGDCHNEAGKNNGSCKIFAFGLLNDLSVKQTLACFGKYYRDDVLGNPDGDDHQNIRNFMKTGWEAVQFSSNALIEK